MEIRRKVFSLLQDENGEERYYSTNEFEISWDGEGEKLFSKRASSYVLGGAVGGPEIDNKRDEKKAKRAAEKKKWNTGEHVGSVLTKGGLTTAAVGGGTALVGGGAALGAALKNKTGAAIVSGTAANLGAKAARIGLGVAAAGAITKGISKAVRKSKEEAKEK